MQPINPIPKRVDYTVAAAPAAAARVSMAGNVIRCYNQAATWAFVFISTDPLGVGVSTPLAAGAPVPPNSFIDWRLGGSPPNDGQGAYATAWGTGGTLSFQPATV